MPHDSPSVLLVPLSRWPLLECEDPRAPASFIPASPPGAGPSLFSGRRHQDQLIHPQTRWFSRARLGRVCACFPRFVTYAKVFHERKKCVAPYISYLLACSISGELGITRGSYILIIMTPLLICFAFPFPPIVARETLVSP